MFLTILISFVSLIALLVLHEFGHFVLAKKFGAKVEEFGIGYPPRIFGKKLGETIYSLNVVPFGAFVKIRGEEGGVEDYRSFIGKPMWQRMAIVLGGVVSFWIISAILLSVVAGVWGLPTAVRDSDSGNLIDPKVQIVQIAADSPAAEAGLQLGDVIVGFDKTKDVQDLISNHPEEVVLTIKRGNETFEQKIIPEISSEGQRVIGVVLSRIALKSSVWYRAPFEGTMACARITFNIVSGWIMGVKSLLGVSELPEGTKMEMLGPLGIFDLLKQYFEMGVNYFLFLISFISIALALANILPIPALDGGKLVFLTIETFRGRPINYRIEKNITATFFVLLIIFMIFVTIKFDIPRVF